MSKTHFEQVPLEVVIRIVEEQIRRGKLAGQMLIPTREIKADVKPKTMLLDAST